MKKRVQYLVGVLLVTPFLALSPVVAAQTTNSGSTSSSSGSSSTSGSTTTTTTTTSNSSSSASKTETGTETKSEGLEVELKKLVEAEGKKKTQADRLKEQIAGLKIKLTAADQAKLKAKCVAAQVKIKEQDAKVDTGLAARGKAYDELLSHLNNIITKLKADGVDVTELTKEQTELKTKIATFKADLAKYKVALADAHGVGCVADPASFKAALETARTARELVATDAKAIRTYVTETIKPTLKTIRATLEKDSNSDTSASSTDKKDSTTTTTTGGNQ